MSDREFWITMILAWLMLVFWLAVLVILDIRISDAAQYGWSDTIWTMAQWFGLS